MSTNHLPIRLRPSRPPTIKLRRVGRSRWNRCCPPRTLRLPPVAWSPAMPMPRRRCAGGRVHQRPAAPADQRRPGQGRRDHPQPRAQGRRGHRSVLRRRTLRTEASPSDRTRADLGPPGRARGRRRASEHPQPAPAVAPPRTEMPPKATADTDPAPEKPRARATRPSIDAEGLIDACTRRITGRSVGGGAFSTRPSSMSTKRAFGSWRLAGRSRPEPPRAMWSTPATRRRSIAIGRTTAATRRRSCSSTR